MLITRVSPLTGKVNTMDLPITEDQMCLIIERSRPIQDILPHLSPAEREFVLTGYTEEDWDKMFRETDEEDIAVMTQEELEEVFPCCREDAGDERFESNGITPNDY